MPIPPLSAAPLALCLLATLANAQRGDRRGQIQPALPSDLEIPPAPALAPKDALRSLRVQPGFEVQLVAAEPLVVDPVCIAFDERGRIWAVEMRGFMPDVDGKGELEPNGRIVTLTDKDGDGVMDESVVFLDGLVLPRAVAVVNEGVLVLAPPHLYLCQDRDGDGRCDEKVSLRAGFGGLQSPEHASNGLLSGLDNWIHFARDDKRLRRIDGKWTFEPTPARGQWGITQDDYGRQFHNGNSDHLRGDLYPAHYAGRNRNLGTAQGVNVQVVRDQSTWPIRVTPGINRGYQKNMLRDYKLARFTAACSPVIYRDDVLTDCHGDAFVCEPAGNFVRRCKVDTEDGGLAGRNAYERDEFLASTDERFRPVDLKVGPDGGLYVVDLYRGILQHRVFVTTFLRKQILSRGLDKPVGLGRIYRVLPTGATRRAVPQLHGATTQALAALLAHPSGWCRDQAQRLLIGRGRAVAEAVREVLGDEDAAAHLGRLHALWVLEGIGALDEAILRAALGDRHPEVRAAAVRLCEPWLGRSEALTAAACALIDDPDPRCVVQVACSLSGVAGFDLGHLVRILALKRLSAPVRGAVLSGVQGRELELAAALAAHRDFAEATDERRRALADLARCVAVEGRPARVAALLDLAARGSTLGWQRAAVLGQLAGHLEQVARKRRRTRVLQLDAAPQALLQLARTDKTAERVAGHLAWPGQADTTVAPVLSAADRRRIRKGKVAYTLRCMACHQTHGKGMPGLAPALVGSPYVLGSPERLAAMILHGVTGPIEVDGVKFDALMPPVPGMTDEEIGLIISYIRNSWGQEGTVVDTPFVEKVRAKFAERAEPFTAKELDAWKQE